MYIGEYSQEQLDGIINKIGHFSTIIDSAEIRFDGILVIEDDHITLQCEFNPEDAYNQNKFRFCTITGKVGAIFLTLCNARIMNSTIEGMFDENATARVTFNASYIVFGETLADIMKIKEISFASDILNMFFEKSPVDLSDLSKEKSIYEHCESISATDKYGDVIVQQVLSTGQSINRIFIDNSTMITYKFIEPLDIESAIERLASVRNLFSFFLNDYISIINISFRDEACKPYHRNNLIINHSEKGFKKEKVFFVSKNALSNNFNIVWKSWLDFYESARPITFLFYEIISEQSKGLNKYLNLIQALEVFSNRYRIDEIKKKNKINKNANVGLKYQIKDLLDEYNDILNVSNTEKLATKLKEIRRYYTHYKKDDAEPSYDEVVSGSYIIQYLLLLVVYSTVGISREVMMETKKFRWVKNIDDDIALLSE